MNRATSKAPPGLTAGQLGHLDTQQKLVELLQRFDAVNAELSRFLGSAHLLLLQVAEFLDQLQYPVDHRVDFLAVSAASRDRRLVIELLRNYSLPPLSDLIDGPDLFGEEQLLREAGL